MSGLTFQAQAWARLVAHIERLPHALLLQGPRGIGKLQLAERFAQLLLCESAARRHEPCGRCEGCRWYAAGSHPDVRFIEPEAIARQAAGGEEAEEGEERQRRKPSMEIKIDQVRALADFLNIGSHRGRLRVAIVHPAEAMNAHAASALLKSLEEPPTSAVFLLVAHHPSRLLATIRSRCVALPVPLPERGAARAWLEAQGVPEAERWLAFAGGAPLQALEYARGGRAESLQDMLQTLAAGDTGSLSRANDREELELLAEILQKHAHDSALAAFGLPRRFTPAGTARPQDRRKWLAYAREMGRNRALARHPLNPRLHAESMLAGLPEK